VDTQNVLKVNEAFFRESFSFDSLKATFDPKDYVIGRIKRAWPQLFSSPEYVDPNAASYEETIRNFLKIQPIPGSILLIVGGIGCGKTSTLVYCTGTVTLCRQCFDGKPCAAGVRNVYVDLRAFDEDSPESMIWAEFERVLTAEVQRSHPNFDFGPDLLAFWTWASGPAAFKTIRHMSFRRQLTAHARIIRDKDGDAVDRAFTHFWLSDEHDYPEGRSVYRAIQLAYITRSKKCKHCNLLCIDNIDQLAPRQQQRIVKFAYEVAAHLECNVVIPVRPYTVSRDAFATANFLHLIHVSPDAAELLEHRVNRFIEKTPAIASIHAPLRSFMTRFRADRTLSLSIRATSGDSGRFLLRNVHNLLVSRILPVNEFDEAAFDPLGLVKNNVLFESLFCDEDRQLDGDCFENLFVVAGRRDVRARFVKLWLICMLRHAPDNLLHCTEIRQLLVTLLGCDEALVAGAIHSLICKTRPLAWSKRYHVFTQDALRSRENDNTIHLTTIGYLYRTQLLDNPYYLRECVYDRSGATPNEKDSVDFWSTHVLSFLEETRNEHRSIRRELTGNYGLDGFELFKKSNVEIENWFAAMMRTLRRLRTVAVSQPSIPMEGGGA
jgi:hypothetical protein